jgi:hypothetical protein
MTDEAPRENDPRSVAVTPSAPPPVPASRIGMLVTITAVLALLVIVWIAVGAVIVGEPITRFRVRPAPVTTETTIAANHGAVVFSDEFRDPSSGWTVQTLPSGTTFSYGATGYVVVAKGTLDHFAMAPYQRPVQQMAISVTATQSNDAPIGAGYGVSCWRGQFASELRYDFLVTTGGDWKVDRRQGGVSTGPVILIQGKSKVALGSTPLAVEGMCATLADQRTTRLTLFVGASKVADFTDTAGQLADVGWRPDLIVTSEAIHPSIVTMTHFEVRDLAR